MHNRIPRAIKNIESLLTALHIPLSSTKVRTRVSRSPGGEIYVIEDFDEDNGRTRTQSSKNTLVEESVLTLAKEAGYLQETKDDSTKTTYFLLSDKGKRMYYELCKERDASELPKKY